MLDAGLHRSLHRLADQVHRGLFDELADTSQVLDRGVVRDRRVARAGIVERVRHADPLLSSDLVDVVVDVVLARTAGLGPLDPLLRDDAVTEVMVNGDGVVWVERHGELETTGTTLGPAEVLGVAERVLAPLGMRIDRRHPVADARLADGSRLHVVVPPVAVDGPCLTIRRFRVRPVELAAFATPGEVRLLVNAVARRCNIVVSGGTGAGKTTLLNALAGCVPASERIVTIEDTAELRLRSEHVVRLEARTAAADDASGPDVPALVRTALRMRPDRIVVGEVRGAEVLGMLAAMNTGHDGSLSTVHANSPVDALRRLETLAVGAAGGLPIRAVRDHIAAAVDLVVQVGRGSGGARRVVAIDEVVRRGGEAGDTPLGTRSVSQSGSVIGAVDRHRATDLRQAAGLLRVGP